MNMSDKVLLLQTKILREWRRKGEINCKPINDKFIRQCHLERSGDMVVISGLLEIDGWEGPSEEMLFIL